MKRIASSLVILAAALPLHAADRDALARGQYLVELLSCAACHTDGQLINDPKADRYLAGSSIGIAYSNHDMPGVVFPSNLTPHKKTGIGRWSLEEVARNIQYGIDRHGRQQLPVMPWPGYAHMAIDDARAIATYLMSLPPVKHKVPANVAPNERSTAPYVRYGVYVFYPNKAGERLDAVKPSQTTR
jgi:mono/diheme cytochrome c family protein